MPSEKTPIPHFDVKGMDRSRESYLVGSSAWFTQFNLRVTRNGLEQVPRKSVITTLGIATCIVSGVPNGFGDSFDCYLDGEITNPTETGTGFSGPWLVSDSPFNNVLGDTFNSYRNTQKSNFLVGTGFTGSWIIN
jgi:hypothetical protein